MHMGFGLALAAAMVLMLAPSAFAGEGCRDGDNPMATGEGFGVAQCATRGRRYHIDDFAGARVHGYVRHASADDPMVWSDRQWRTDLMRYSNVSDDRYDRRFHHVAPPLRIVRRAMYIVVAPAIEATIRTAIPREGRSLKLRTLMRDSSRSSARPMGHSCPDGGVLMLRWTGYREKAACVTSGAKRQTPKRVNVFPGQA